MSTTLNQEENNNPTKTNGVPGATETSKTGETATPGQHDGGELDDLEGAQARARARLAKDKNETDSSPASSEQAAGDDAGASTQNADEGDTPTDDKDGETTGGDGSPDSIEAPADWSKEERESFSTLPKEGQELLLQMHGNMQAGLTKATQQIAEFRKDLGGVFETMQEHTVHPNDASDAIRFVAAFKKDPKAALTQLAEEHDIDLFVEAPSLEVPPQEVLDDPAKFSKWMADQAEKRTKSLLKQAREEEAAKATEAQAEADQKAAREALANELEQAEKDLPNFTEHRTATIALMQDMISAPTVEMGYRLATWEGLKQLADEGLAAKQELAEVKTKLERFEKLGTTVPSGEQGEDKAMEGLDEHQKAQLRAKRRLQAQKSGASIPA